MKKLFKINDLELANEIIIQSGIKITKNNEFLEVDNEIYNFSIMKIMQMISNSPKYVNAFNAWYDSLDRIHEMPIFIYDKPRAESWAIEGKTIDNGIITDFTINEIKANWETIKIKENKENLGIESINAYYIETNELQDPKYEYKKITKFLEKYKEDYAERHNQNKENIKIEFINYGKTELVFVLTDELNNKYTLLVKQPKIEKEEIIEEINNLYELTRIDDNVVAAIDTFSLYDQILYVTPYIYQARCIASDKEWGMYVPEPFYRFVPFTKEQESIVNSCMIAKLLCYYNFEKQEGLAACKLGGGDFMLPKGWEKEKPTIENTFNNLFLIAARKKFKCTFPEYIATIIEEFTKKTIDEDEKTLTINKRGRVAMDISDIQNGISLGLDIIKERDGYTYKKKK